MGVNELCERDVEANCRWTFILVAQKKGVDFDTCTASIRVWKNL